MYYGRYIDDIIVIAKSRAGLRHVFNALNSRHASIKLTSEDPEADGFIPFLNTKVKVSEGQVNTMWYKKPASKNILLHSRSCHPGYMKANVVQNLLQTATRLTTKNNDEITALVKKILEENGYTGKAR